MSISILVDRDYNIQVRHGCNKETHFIDIASLGKSLAASFFSDADNAEVAQLKDSLRKLSDEMNVIRARSGVPYDRQGMRSDIDPESFSQMIDEARELLR